MITIPFNFNSEIHPGGTICWSNELYPYEIYATPYFENSRGISVQVSNDRDGIEIKCFNIPYIGYEAYWAIATPSRNDEAFIHYEAFMRTTGLIQILTRVFTELNK